MDLLTSYLRNAKTQFFDNTVKGILSAELTQDAIDEITDLITNLEDVNVKQTLYEEITAKGIDETVNQFNGKTSIDTTIWDSSPYNAEAKEIDAGGNYTGEDIFTAGGTHIKAVIDSVGDYLLSGTPDPALYPRYAIVYNRKGTAKKFGEEEIPSVNIIATIETPPIVRDVENAEIRPKNDGDDYNAMSGGFKDDYVTTPIKLGELGETEFDTVKKSVVGAINGIHLAIAQQDDTGFVSWTGTGDYYQIGTDTPTVGETRFTLLRGGLGRIQGTPVDFLGNQFIQLASGETAYVYIDNLGILQSSVIYSEANEGFPLFEAWRCSEGIFTQVVKENHPFAFCRQVSEYLHRTVGTVFTTDSIGSLSYAPITIGDGTLITDRQMKVLGKGTLIDHGISTDYIDTAGLPMTQGWPYLNSVGKWNCYANQSEFPMVYNNGGTPTTIPTGKFGVFKGYGSKDDLNSISPVTFGLMSTDFYTSLAAAEAAIADDKSNEITAIQSPSAEFANIELARLGYAIVQNNINGGYIYSVDFDLAVVGSGSATGSSATLASLISVVTTTFSRILNGSDTNVQVALETIDNNAAIDSEVVHKTGNETISDTKTFSSNVVNNPAPTIGDHLTNKTYVDQYVTSAIKWQTAVLDIVDTLPGSPSTGDRYILSTDNLIYDYNGATWDAITPLTGWTVWVVDDTVTPANNKGWYNYNGSAWVSIITGVDLSSLGITTSASAINTLDDGTVDKFALGNGVSGLKYSDNIWFGNNGGNNTLGFGGIAGSPIQIFTNNYGSVPSTNGLYVTNTSTGNAIIALDVLAAGGDPFISFNVSGVQAYSMGIDNTDDKFKLSANYTDVGSNVLMQSDSSGNFDFLGKLRITSDGTVSSQRFYVRDTATSAFDIAFLQAPSLTTGNEVRLKLGVDDSTKNTAELNFQYDSTGSDDNCLELGFFGVQVMALYADKRVVTSEGSVLQLGRIDNTNEGAEILWETPDAYENWITDVYQRQFRISANSSNNTDVVLKNDGTGYQRLGINKSPTELISITQNIDTNSICVIENSKSGANYCGFRMIRTSDATGGASDWQLVNGVGAEAPHFSIEDITSNATGTLSPFIIEQGASSGANKNALKIDSQGRVVIKMEQAVPTTAELNKNEVIISYDGDSTIKFTWENDSNIIKTASLVAA